MLSGWEKGSSTEPNIFTGYSVFSCQREEKKWGSVIKVVRDYYNKNKETMETWVRTLKSSAEFQWKLQGRKKNSNVTEEYWKSSRVNSSGSSHFLKIWRLVSPQHVNCTVGKAKRRRKELLLPGSSWWCCQTPWGTSSAQQPLKHKALTAYQDSKWIVWSKSESHSFSSFVFAS